MQHTNPKSAIQPKLEAVENFVRFKGCYFLTQVKNVLSNNTTMERVAVFQEIDGTDQLNVRLLGNHFLCLEKYINDYVDIEVAIKRYKRGHFFYLAWYEPVIRKPNMQPLAYILEEIAKEDIKNITLKIENQVSHINTGKLRKLCMAMIKSYEYSLAELKKIIRVQPELSDLDFFLTLVEIRFSKDDIGVMGKFIISLKDKTIYNAWENKNLGI
ncbi:hypothetical protein MUS1_06335 [Marinomonas ushuaiensis DSM 15871]|uniref:Uncharacterized protein n=1 Tax=Marinomonas ushuaiensis DSM 15871 TaxID=1122207 RepID=X7E1H0_9GAMM|nr:hypothetical protein [Marinomonas ushuaiensis]ETX09715.1 hypothetical protein MUS1_06335 [Marinomonas ushuaiensis DSM 15871]